MDIHFVEFHPTPNPKSLNQEWFVLENRGEAPFSTKNCTLVTRRGKKRTQLGTLDPGFSIAPGQRVRVHTGNPGKKAHGRPPQDEQETYFLFLKAPVLRGKGLTLELSLRSHVVATAVFDPGAESGVAAF